jgi:Kef-type K+ transport system membrane component KefB/voltage-gated potassium channel Kch
MGVNLAVGFLLCGIALGPLGANLIKKTELTNGMGHTGLLIFIFAVGLEMPFHRIKSLYKYIFGLGMTQVVLTSAVLYTILRNFFYTETALILAISFSFSSTAIIVQILSERNETTGQVGRRAFSILLFQDIAAICLFVYLGCKFCTNAPAQEMITRALLGVCILSLSSYILYRLSQKIFYFYPQTGVVLPFILFVIFFFSWITEFFGISAELGPFVAGITLATTSWRHHISNDIHPFLSVFLPAFFINMGSDLLTIPGIKSLPWIIGSISSLIVVKAVTLLIIISSFRMNSKNDFPLSVLISGCSEFFLMIMPTIKNLVGEEIASGMFLTSLISMIITPVLFFFAKKLFPYDLEKDPKGKIGSIVIFGFGRVGKSVAYILEKNFISFTVIDYKDSAIEEAQKLGFQTLKGNVRDIEFLKKSGINSAKLCLLTFSKSNTPSLVRSLRNIFPELSLCVKIKNENEAEKLVGLGTQIVLPETTQSGMQMASNALSALGFSEAHVQRMIHLRSEPRFFE